MKKLDARLQAVADLVHGEIIADIGSDHAYLPVWLVQNNKIKKAYAIDISAKCVERVKANLVRFNISQEIIRPVLSNGLNALPEAQAAELTDIIIAGMGGETVAGIMGGIADGGAARLANINFILQPNTKTDVLKEYLLANNFKILHEIRIQDKKRYYNIMRAAYVCF